MAFFNSFFILVLFFDSFFGLPYVGVNLSGGEWASGTFFPSTNTVNYFLGKGMNIIRLPFLWVRIFHRFYFAYSSKIRNVFNQH